VSTPAQFFDNNGELRLDGTLVGGGGAQPDIKLAATTLTSAQLLLMGSAAVAVTPTPAANQAQWVLFVTGAYHFNTSAYTGSIVLGVAPNYRGFGKYLADTTNFMNLGFDTQVMFTAGGFYTQGAAGEFDHTDLAGSPWSIFADTVNTPIAAGDGTLTVYCTYYTMTT
jgi:opacity protein-like surface antigen